MIVGFLILGTTLGAWRFRRAHRIITWSATVALVVLPVQVALG